MLDKSKIELLSTDWRKDIPYYEKDIEGHLLSNLEQEILIHSLFAISIIQNIEDMNTNDIKKEFIDNLALCGITFDEYMNLSRKIDKSKYYSLDIENMIIHSNFIDRYKLSAKDFDEVNKIKGFRAKAKYLGFDDDVMYISFGMLDIYRVINQWLVNAPIKTIKGGKLTNIFLMVDKSKKIESIKRIKGQEIVFKTIGDENYNITYNTEQISDNLVFSPNVHMMMLEFNHYITHNNYSPKVYYSVDEYMRARGLKDRKSAKEKIKKDILALSDLTFSYKESSKKLGKFTFDNHKIISSIGKDEKGNIINRKGYIAIDINPYYSNILKSLSTIEFYPDCIYKYLNYPIAFNIIRKLSSDYSMNRYKRSVIGVKKLLYASGLNVNESHKSERIIIPFWKALNNIADDNNPNGFLKMYRVVKKGGIELSEQELERCGYYNEESDCKRYEYYDFNLFCSLYINYEILDNIAKSTNNILKYKLKKNKHNRIGTKNNSQ